MHQNKRLDFLKNLGCWKMWLGVSQGLYVNHGVGVLCSLSPESFRLVTRPERATAPWLTCPGFLPTETRAWEGRKQKWCTATSDIWEKRRRSLTQELGKQWISHSLAKAPGSYWVRSSSKNPSSYTSCPLLTSQATTGHREQGCPTSPRPWMRQSLRIHFAYSFCC